MTSEGTSRHHFNENDPHSIGTEMRRRRDHDGVARSRLSGVLGVDPRTLARWEKGGAGATMDNLHLVTRALESLRQDMGGEPIFTDLSKISTLELALELTSRARIMESRDRTILDLKSNLQKAELDYLWPEGL